MTLFATPASAELDARARELAACLHETSPNTLREPLRALAYRYVDDVIDGLILGLLSEGTTSPLTTSLIRNLAGVVKSVGHGIVGSVFSAAKPDELVAMARYLEARIVRVERAGGAEPRLAFPIDAALDREFTRVIEAAREGRATTERQAFAHVMHQVIDEALRYHLDTPVGLVELGFVARKALAVGRGAIHAGAISAAQRSIAHDGEQQLADLADFLERCRIAR